MDGWTEVKMGKIFILLRFNIESVDLYVSNKTVLYYMRIYRDKKKKGLFGKKIYLPILIGKDVIIKQTGKIQ